MSGRQISVGVSPPPVSKSKTDVNMESTKGVEISSTSSMDLVSPVPLDSSQSSSSVSRTKEDDDADMEIAKTASEDASLEDDQAERLNLIILDSLSSAKESGRRTRAYDIRLFTRIECLLFRPNNCHDDIPEDLYDLTEQGRRNGDFSELLKNRWFIGRRLNLDTENKIFEIRKKELERMCKTAIQDFADVLQDYATGQLDYHFSSRHDGKGPHANVHHPDADRVHLLLAGLGDPNETLTSWEDIFHSTEEEPQNTFATTVINIPGYGKTRLLFEAVEKYFLIYFTCSNEKATWATGSGDVQWVVETVNPTSKWTYEGQAAQRAIYVLIYARMYVLIYFLDLALSHCLAPLDARRRLLLLQACPPCLASSDDLFVHIAKVVQSFDDETLRRAAGQSLDKFRRSIKEVLHGTTDSPRIHFTFDEVHNATRDPWLFNRCSIFPRMLQMVDFSLRPRAIVCAASQISVNMLNIGTLPPVSGVLSYASNTRHLQRDNMEEYVLRHLKPVPPRVLERIKTWLFPRPRLVARLIEMYMTAAQNGVKRIPYHRILSSAFEVSTGYRPMDAIDLEVQEEEIPESILGLSFGCSVLERKSFHDRTFMRTVSRLLYRWMLSNSSTLTLEWNESPKLIELGVTPLPPLEPRSPSYFTGNVCDDVALTEAYGAASLVALLGSPNIDIFKLCMTEAIIIDAEQPELEQTQKDIFERSIVWTLMNNIGKEDGGVLEDIFEFRGYVPLWTKQPYRLITFARGNNVPIHVTWKSGASPRLGFRTREPDDIEHWLKDPKGVPFIFKDDRHCLAFVENRATLERSVLVVHGAPEDNCEIEKQFACIAVPCRPVPINFAIKPVWDTLVGLAWFGLWLVFKVATGLLGLSPAPVGQPLTGQISQTLLKRKSSDNPFGKHSKDGVQHQHAVYMGVKDMKGIGEGRLGLFVLSSPTQLTAP